MAVLAAPAGAQTARPMLDYASAATIRDACVAWAANASWQSPWRCTTSGGR
jgi:hypothetical protein